jgi:hypothetical protein
MLSTIYGCFGIMDYLCLISHAQSPVLFSNLHVILVLLVRESGRSFTMEILLNPNTVVMCCWCYASGVDNGAVVRRSRNSNASSCRFS